MRYIYLAVSSVATILFLSLIPAHAQPTSKIIGPDETLVIDAGQTQNYDTIFNLGTIEIHGYLQVTTTLVNAGVINNSGELGGQDLTLTNFGIINNLGTIDNYQATIDNQGVINNNMTIIGSFGDRIYNHNNGQINNFGLLTLGAGVFNNTDATIINNGTIVIRAQSYGNGMFMNNGTVVNNNLFAVDGNAVNQQVFTNHGTISLSYFGNNRQDQSFIAECGSTFDNIGSINGQVSQNGCQTVITKAQPQPTTSESVDQ